MGHNHDQLYMKQFLLSWQAPLNSNIADYCIEYGLHDQEWQTYPDGISNITSGVVSGLDPCVFYRFRVAGINSVGTGAHSNVVSGAILGSAPMSPQNLSAVVSNRKIVLSWEEPNNPECVVQDYSLEYSTGNEPYTQFRTGGIDNTYILYNLTNDIIYNIRLAGINVIGTGSYSDILSVMPINNAVKYINTETLLRLNTANNKRLIL